MDKSKFFYFISFIGYDADNNVTGHEGDLIATPSKQLALSTFQSLVEYDSNALATLKDAGTDPYVSGIFYWKFQVEEHKVANNGDSICNDILDEIDFFLN